MKICLVSRSTPMHHKGGMERVAWSLACEFDRLGHDVSILTTRLPAGKVLPDIPFTVRVIEGAAPGRYSATWWSETRRMARAGYFESFDIVMGVGGGAHGIVFSRGPRPAVVIQSHGTPWMEIVSKAKVKTVRSFLGIAKNLFLLGRDWRLRRYDQIVAIGPAVRSSLKSRPMCWLVGETPTVTVVNGIDVDSYRFDASARESVRGELGVAAESPVAISVGRLTRQKGVLQGLNGIAAARQMDSRWHYIIVGEGPEHVALEKAASSCGLAERVHFVGPHGPESVSRYLSAADVFLFPTLRQEGLALAPLEAAANGLVTVTSNHAVTDGVPSITADPNDPSSVASGLNAIAERRQGTRPSLLADEYTLSYAAKRYIDLFDEIAARSGVK